jgi:alpha-1,4-digalacturonate transport system substrate-binding protein
MKQFNQKMKFVFSFFLAKRFILFPIVSLFAFNLNAAEIKFICYQDSNECDVIAKAATEWEASSGHKLNIETVGYQVVREQLENLLESDAAPDVARVTNLGGLNKFYLDLTPYVDVSYWEKNYGATLPWYRKPSGDNGIYGWQTQLTVTGPYVNVTMFEDAGVDMPEEGASWDDWAEALRQVKSELGLTAGLAIDRTAHRWAGPAFSYGAKFHKDGVPILVDAGFRKFAEVFVGWHKEGLMPAEGWPAGAGTAYKNAAPLFLDGTVAMHMSGSWMLGNYDKNITDFEWKVVPIPCGPGGCGAMPGGSGVVAFKSTKHPEAAASFINFLAQTDNAAHFASNTSNITAHQGLQKRGIDYSGVSPVVSAGLSTFAANAGKAAETTPQAYWFQGYNKNFAIYGIVPDYITKAITGELSLDDALNAIDADVAAKIAE